MKAMLDKSVETSAGESTAGSSERDLQVYRRKFDDLKDKT